MSRSLDDIKNYSFSVWHGEISVTVQVYSKGNVRGSYKIRVFLEGLENI